MDTSDRVSPILTVFRLYSLNGEASVARVLDAFTALVQGSDLTNIPPPVLPEKDCRAIADGMLAFMYLNPLSESYEITIDQPGLRGLGSAFEYSEFASCQSEDVFIEGSTRFPTPDCEDFVDQHAVAVFYRYRACSLSMRGFFALSHVRCLCDRIVAFTGRRHSTDHVLTTLDDCLCAFEV